MDRHWDARSPDGLYRYALGRPTGLSSTRSAAVLMLNPSTAIATKSDPTDRRVLDFVRSWGYGSYTIINPWALIATDREKLLSAADPVGPDNDQWVRETARLADIVVAGWGTYPMQHQVKLMPRIEHVLTLIDKPIHAFRLTKGGSPEHPLYLPKGLEPVVWRS